MERQEVYALLAVLPDDLKEKVGINIRRITSPAYRFIDGNRSDRSIKCKDFFPDCDKVATGREIHQGIGTIHECCFCLFLFQCRIATGAGGPDIHVYFDLTPFANRAQPVQPLRVCRNNDSARLQYLVQSAPDPYLPLVTLL